MRNNIFGVDIDYPFKKSDFDSLLSEGFLLEKKKFIFTINPEFLVDSVKDEYFRAILNKGFFNSADGIGVVLAQDYHESKLRNTPKLEIIYSLLTKLLSGKLSKKRFTGVEISERIFEYADKNYSSIFLLGGDKKRLVSENLLIDLEKKYPNIQFIGASSSFSHKPNDDQVTIDFIKSCMLKKRIDKIDFILVAYGHPYQEKWIDRNSKKLPISYFVGVGGTFDFLSGNIQRAPKIIQNLGLEWLYRLARQPKRFKRIFKAVVVFSYLFFIKNKQF